MSHRPGMPGDSVLTLIDIFPGTKVRPRRPCDSCRRRKSRCEIEEGAIACVLCQFHRQECTFLKEPQPRKRKATSTAEDEDQSGSSSANREIDRQPGRGSHEKRLAVRKGPANTQIETEPGHTQDYADLEGPSLLKRTLGLQSHRHGRMLGLSSVYEPTLLSLDAFAEREDLPIGREALYRASRSQSFILFRDESTRNHEDEVYDVDTIESIVSPHGEGLINLYFRIVHPSFPIMHKKVYLEKYKRSHRELSPPLLAAVYILALNWWSYSTELALLPKPDVGELEKLASKTMNDVIYRPKLSTIQAGLLLLQTPAEDSWPLTTQLIGLGQELGLHLDCTDWRIPDWEKGLRKRLAWALFMQDKWGSLAHGRPTHIHSNDWDVKPVVETDFPENAEDEDDEEGSTEVENGRMLFCEMIRLSEILSILMTTLYSIKSAAELQTHASDGVRWFLERAKPIQMSLRQWHSALPDVLAIENVAPRKLSSAGYLHLAYCALEICLHRRIVQLLSVEQDQSLVEACRKAAKARLYMSIDFVRNLRPEQLHSFWFFASHYGFALIATFAGLLWATASSKEEADMYKKKLEEYHWLLRLSSRSTDCIDQAMKIIATSTDVLVKGIPLRSHTSEQGSGYTSPNPGASSRSGDVLSPYTTPASYDSEYMWYETTGAGVNFGEVAQFDGEYVPADFMYQGHYLPSHQ
ncbi:hypothetical protein EJ05DRAFT_255564 [Pseudovirgaria hyperparasitica]|uniref:Zn(2)-C6 fungal-type domain-containing protein n=1 Tax=Pseudovirgaria hyperparasitica TaxID=470096 RepID=A0A6A6WIW4_9PEZI|nr:uncharacterized protein EJ05DRAFT_255564 [Pseudovirgaria hyperparasitica]KAF2761181.1 hypothetical protein EJ05DRAFT_255564 [Pseudovirgaria hyperparasitica]